MRLETFFEKFDQFADAPEGVAKMRELVLELAVQGKVAEQDPSDETAAELLQRLINFKLANPLTGRSGRSKERVLEIEANNDGLPANWVNTTIGEVLYVIRGASPRPKGDPQYFSETRTPYHWVKISDIRKHGQNGLLMDTDEFLTEAGMRKSVLLPRGTLVLTNSATIGVPIVLGIEGCCIHDGFLAFPNFPHELLSQKFFLYLFHTLKKHAERNARGLAQLNLNTELVRSFPFGLPPFAEQKRIVAKVDELMALCDRLEAQQQERDTRHAALSLASLARFADAPTAANLYFLFHPSYTTPPADLRKSILKLAVQGLLVRHDAESAKWETRKLRDVTTKIGSGSTPAGGKDSYQESGVPLIRSMNVHFAGFVRDGLAFLNEEQADKLKNVTVRVDDVLLNITGASIGRVTTAPNDMEGARVNQHVCIVRPTTEILPGFLQLFLASPVVQNLIDDVQVGATREALTKSMIEQFEVPVPSMAEQHRIVAKVEQLLALVDELETQLAASRATAAKLMEAIVLQLTSQE